MAAEKNNKYAQEWTLENAKPYFEDALNYAENSEDCLCLQDAIFRSGIPYSTFYYLSDNHEVLGKLKSDIQQAIIRRINRGALDKELPAPGAASIWRMKQLGEKDQQFIDQHNTGTINQNISVTSKEDIEEIENLKDKFENEDCE